MFSIVRIVDKLIVVVATSALVVSAVMILLNVFNRYVVLGWLRSGAEQSQWIGVVFTYVDSFFSSFSATADEIPGLLLVWITFLGAYLAYRQGGHIAFDLLIEKLPKKLKLFTALISDGVVIAFLMVVLLESIRMIMVDGETEIETAEISQGWFMSIIPISSGLIAIALVINIAKRLQWIK